MSLRKGDDRMQALENQHSFQNQQEERAFVPQTEQNPYPMKWHKWVIWVQLWISALSNLYSAYTFLSGAGYSALAYSLYPGLRAAGVFAGIGSLAIAVYAVYVRFQLSRLKQGAPGKLVMLSAFALVLSFLYRMWICSAVNVSFKWSAELWSNIMSSLAMMKGNYSYYARRSDLFVN